MTFHPVLKGVAVDIRALHSLAHRCTPGRCKAVKSCCARYDVTVSESEISTIVDWTPAAAEFSTGLASGNEFINPFDIDDEGRTILDVRKDGGCVYSFHQGAETLMCSLHAAALKAQAPPETVKPQSCTLWPLALTEDRKPKLSVQAGAYSFPCNRKRYVKSSRLHKGVAEIIRRLWGDEFLRQIETARSDFT